MSYYPSTQCSRLRLKAARRNCDLALAGQSPNSLNLNPWHKKASGVHKVKRVKFVFIAPVLVVIGLCTAVVWAQTSRWPEQKANDWYARQPWLIGSNYIPKSAINQLEMWQEATFTPAQIETELTWPESLGMNTMRVFLHDLLWQQDAAGFQQRIDSFLTIASRHHIRPMFVLFDSCWDPLPHLGPQHPPIPGVHNSGWVARGNGE